MPKLSIKGVLWFVAGVAAANIALKFVDNAAGGKLSQLGAR